MGSEEEYRRHTRIREEVTISWRVEGAGRYGEGLVRDISVSGVLLEVSSESQLAKGTVFSLKAAAGQEDLVIPDKAKLVWSKAMKMEKGKYLCGLEFIEPSDSIVVKMTQHVENWLARMAEAANVNILDNYFRDRNRR
ncbi:MAG: PilZ domain-containing protein [Candidatus Omnitrophica bacterium]|nr:PilZ domain-containing protein [Candidatus Omnitrophota bacterium]